jgi:Flp pilus assembly secretin CpaC
MTMRKSILVLGLMPLLAGFGRAAAQQPGAVEEINRAISHISEPVAELRLEQGHSKVVLFKQNVVRASIADPGIVETTPFTQREVELIGKSVGRTTVSVWLGDQQTSELFSFVVYVQPPQKDLALRSGSWSSRFRDCSRTVSYA